MALSRALCIAFSGPYTQDGDETMQDAGVVDVEQEPEGGSKYFGLDPFRCFMLVAIESDIDTFTRLIAFDMSKVTELARSFRKLRMLAATPDIDGIDFQWGLWMSLDALEKTKGFSWDKARLRELYYDKYHENEHFLGLKFI